MAAIRRSALSSVSFTVILLLTGPMLGQFKETYEPPGYLLEWGSYGGGNSQFYAPQGLAVDLLGNLWVADRDNHAVKKFDGTGTFLTQIGGSYGTGDYQFDTVWGVAVDRAGNIYVSDRGNDRIQKFNSAGTFVTKWGSNGATDGKFDEPLGVAVDASGNVYVADSNNDRIQKFDGTGSFLGKWGGYGTAPGDFVRPYGVAVDDFGNVHVADFFNDRIQKFDSSGNFLTMWGIYGSGDGQFIRPEGVAVDTLGYVYAVDNVNDRVQKFDNTGNYVTKWGSSGESDGEFTEPVGIAVDQFGNVYVADTNNDRIEKFAPVIDFTLAGYDSSLSVTTLDETVAVRTLFRLQNNGAPRFAFKNTNSDIEWSFQQSGPGNFLISKEGTGGPELQVYGTGMVRMGPGGANRFNLYPNGNLTIAGSLTANGSTFPDYVFEPDYDLMPLSDLRTFIEQEKRLPEIPSAEEVKKQGGHNMTELQLKLLEKIEELTLYTLEQQRAIDAQRKRDDDQQRTIEGLKVELAGIRAMLVDR